METVSDGRRAVKITNSPVHSLIVRRTLEKMLRARTQKSLRLGKGNNVHDHVSTITTSPTSSAASTYTPTSQTSLLPLEEGGEEKRERGKGGVAEGERRNKETREKGVNKLLAFFESQGKG